MNDREQLIELLTKRELEILALLVENKTNQEIADQLHLALSSVKWYAGEIYAKLGVENRRQAVKKAGELGLLAKPSQPPGDALPPPPASQNPNNLPQELTSFIGRDEEIELLAKRIRDGKTRLLTLTGAGGTGKTRLSLKVAETVLDAFPAGVWLVELAPLGDPELVAPTAAQVLGVQEVPGTPLIDSLCSFLKKKRALLILDNCEHLLSACADLAGKLLRSGPEVQLLASSREILNVPGEWSFRVPSLPVPPEKPLPPIEEFCQYESVRLFAERAAQVSAGFSIHAANAQAIGAICRRLDGIPLAMELAASRVRVMPVVQVAARLDNVFRLLMGGARTVMPRQQTLKATIDWSYNLLNEKEKTALQRLSVFSGGWTLDAAEKVIPDSPVKADCAQDSITSEEMLDVLASLVDKSLVIPSGSEGESATAFTESRYRMLETIRQYARDRLLEAGCGEAVRDRHLAYYQALGEDADRHFRTKDQIHWLDLVDVELDNMRLALEWSLGTGGSAEDHLLAGMRLVAALKWFWYIRSRYAEGNTWLDALLTLEAETRGEIPLAVGEQSEAYLLTWVRCVSALAVDIPYYPIKIPIPQVIEMLSLAAELCRKIGPSANRDLFWVLLYHGGLHPDGLSLKEQALQVAQENHFRFEESDALYHLWLHYLYKIQDFEKGAQYLEPSLAIVKDLQDVDGMAERMHGMIFVAAYRGDINRVRSLFNEAISYHRQVNNFRSIHTWEIVILRFSQDPQEIQQAERATQYFEELQDIPNTLLGYVYLIQAEWSNGNRQRAERFAEHALSLSDTIDRTTFDLIYILIYASGLAALSQNYPKARQYLQKAGPLIPKHLSVNMESRIVFLDILGAYWILCGDALQGAKILGAVHSSVKIYQNLGFPWQIQLHEEMTQKARLALGEEAFQAAWQAGQAVSFLQAFDSFLEEFLRSSEQQGRRSL